jgi:hypothetical protein
MRIKVIFVSFILLLLLVGCVSVGTSRKTPPHNFKSGVHDLEIDFLKNNPPDEVFQNSEFKIVVELHNDAAYSITNGEIKLTGLDTTYFEFLDEWRSFNNLEGRSLEFPQGEKDFVEFEVRSLDLKKRDEIEANFKVDVKYSSQIDFADTVCVNPDLYSIYNSGCKVDNEKSYAGQGGPVAVADLKEIISPGGNVEFRLLLRNRGDGEAKVLTFSSAQLGGKDMSCEFKGAKGDKRTSKLKGRDEVNLICNSDLQSFKSYETTLTINFVYDYFVSEDRSIDLIK